MYKTEQELFSQHIALRQTYAYMQGNAEQIKDFYGISGFYSVTFTGCGAMFSLCKSAEMSLKMRGGLTAMSYAAGDLTLNMPSYRDMLNGTLMVVLSRSGNTSEIIHAVEKARRDAGALTLSICSNTKSKISSIADLSLELPWAHDEAITTTRGASNMFLVNLCNIALLSGDNKLLDEIKNAADAQEDFISGYSAELEGIGQSGTWDKCVILADGELAGVAECGALTMKRVAKIPASHCNILDVRHGENAMIDNRTLVIAAISPIDDVYQSVLLHELHQRGAQIMTISSRNENVYGSELNVVLPSYENYAVRGIPLLFSLQAIAYYKAIGDGKNPDEADGLSAWVRL